MLGQGRAGRVAQVPNHGKGQLYNFETDFA